MADVNGAAGRNGSVVSTLQIGLAAAALGGGLIMSFVSLRADIQSAAERASLAIADTKARIAILESRRESDDRFQGEMRRDLARLIETVTEIRVHLATAKRRGDFPSPLPNGGASNNIGPP